MKVQTSSRLMLIVSLMLAFVCASITIPVYAAGDLRKNMLTKTAYPGGPGRGTHRGIGEAMRLAEAFCCEFVDVRGLRILRAIAGKPGYAIILRNESENIGLLHRIGWTKIQKVGCNT
jgi:hypothetical protein